MEMIMVTTAMTSIANKFTPPMSRANYEAEDKAAKNEEL